MTLATDMSILYYGNCQYMTNQKTIKKNKLIDYPRYLEYEVYTRYFTRIFRYF